MSEQKNQLKKYVRVRNYLDNRFVEFDFAINEPSLFVELIMPIGAFRIFCEKNNVIHMTSEQADAVDKDMEKWRYGDETLMSVNHANK